MSTEPPPNDAPHPAEIDDVEVPEPIVAEARGAREDAQSIKPPHSLEAEREVLAACFVDPNCVPAMREEGLQPSDFYLERHQVICAVLCELHDRGTAIDIVTAQIELKSRGLYDRVGGARTLGELLDRSGTVSNLEHYIAIVRSKARLRFLADTAKTLCDPSTLQDVHDVDAFVETAKARITALFERVEKQVEPLTLDTIAERSAKGEPNWLEAVPPDVSVLMRNPDGSPFLLNSRVGVLEAPGGTGKSWLLIQLAVAVACGGRWLNTYQCQKGKVLLALGEEKDEEIWRRVWRVASALGLSDYERSEVARNLVPMGLDGEEVAFLEKAPDGNIVSTQWFGRFHKAIKAKCFKLVILDPLSMFGGPEVEGDPYVATKLIRHGAMLTRSPGEPALLFSAHGRKNKLGTNDLDADNMRGSSALKDGARWVCSCAKRTDKITAIKVTKTNYTVAGDELLLARAKGGVLRPATDDEVAEYQEARKEARAKAKGP